MIKVFNLCYPWKPALDWVQRLASGTCRGAATLLVEASQLGRPSAERAAVFLFYETTSNVNVHHISSGKSYMESISIFASCFIFVPLNIGLDT